VRGADVRVAVNTDYPFREIINIAVTPARNVRFPLQLRVPAWAEGATVRVGGGAEERATAGALHRIDREWAGQTNISLRFPMRPVVSVRYNEGVAVERGPLVYSLQIAEAWSRVNADKPHRELPHADFEVRPASAWNYGLVADEQRPHEALRFEERPIGDKPFSPDGAGVVAHAHGRLIPGWKILHGWAGELSPADTASGDPGTAVTDQPVEPITLVPYGCTNIRITEFPKVRDV
jgi:hypothetical protein